MTSHNPTPGFNRCSGATLITPIITGTATVLSIRINTFSLLRKNESSGRRKNGGDLNGARLTAQATRGKQAETLSRAALRRAPPATSSLGTMTKLWQTVSVRNVLRRPLTKKEVILSLDQAWAHLAKKPIQQMNPLVLANCLRHRMPSAKWILTATTSAKLLFKTRSFLLLCKQTPHSIYPDASSSLWSSGVEDEHWTWKSTVSFLNLGTTKRIQIVRRLPSTGSEMT